MFPAKILIIFVEFLLFLASYWLFFLARFYHTPLLNQLISPYLPGGFCFSLIITASLYKATLNIRNVPLKNFRSGLLKSGLFGLVCFFAVSFILKQYILSRFIIIAAWSAGIIAVYAVKLLFFRATRAVCAATAEKPAATVNNVKTGHGPHNIVFILAVICVSTVLAELFVSVLLKITKKDISMYRIPPGAFLDGHYTPHPYFVYELVPNFKYMEYGKNKYSINSLGFRGDEVSLAKKDGTFRIICVGGSTTFGGAGLSDNYHTYPYVLQKMLKERFPREEIEVINAGVAAYSSAENLVNLELRLLDLKPDMVIINQGINDAGIRTFPSVFGFHNDYSHYRKPLYLSEEGKFRGFLRKHSSLYILFAGLAENQEERTITYHTRWHDPERYIVNSPWNILKDTSEKPDTSYAFRRNTEIMAKLLKSYNIKVILVTDPHYTRLVDKTWDRYIRQHNETVRDISAKYGIPLADLEDRMMRENLFIADGIHMTDEGANLKANLVFLAIVKNKLIR